MPVASLHAAIGQGDVPHMSMNAIGPRDRGVAALHLLCRDSGRVNTFAVSCLRSANVAVARQKGDRNLFVAIQSSKITERAIPICDLTELGPIHRYPGRPITGAYKDL